MGNERQKLYNAPISTTGTTIKLKLNYIKNNPSGKFLVTYSQ